MLTEANLKKRENVAILKEDLNRFIWSVLKEENNLPLDQNESQSSYKFHIGFGNNSMMVRNVMK